MGLADAQADADFISEMIKARIEPALDSGLVERTVPDKPNSRLQKYRRASGR